MTSGILTITGTDGAPYSLGQPIWVFAGNALLAKLDPVPLLKNGTELHIEAFAPTRLVREEPRHVGRLIFLEICDFISQNFQQIQAVSFVLSRQIDLIGGGAEVAAARSETMSRIGAVDVHMTPKSDAKPGHFAVSGVWIYSERTYAALLSVLEQERQYYRQRAIGARANEPTGVIARLRHLVSGGA